MSDTVLIVDDNFKYAGWIRSVLESVGFAAEHVPNARDGRSAIKKEPEKYVAVFSDITMEHPGAGLTLVPRIRLAGYRGAVILVSTGFDLPVVFLFSRFALRLLGVDGLVVKQLLRTNGEWKIAWLRNRPALAVIRERLASVTRVPNWHSS